MHIVKDNPERRYVVVSAPGKANDQEQKVTDHLINCSTNGTHLNGISAEQSYIFIKDKFTKIATGIGANEVCQEAIQDLERRLSTTYKTEAMKEDAVKAWGEDTTARIIASYMEQLGMQARYVNPKDAGMIVTEEFGNAEMLKESYENMRRQMPKEGIIVFPGFFAYTKDGDIATFSRGGSDKTGAIISNTTRSDLYENWTDRDGVLSGVPGIVTNPKPIKTMTYDEMNELADMGFGILHPEAMYPAMSREIPIRVRNTFNKENEGTLIGAVSIENGRILTGVGHRNGYCMMTIKKAGMGREKKVLQRTLDIMSDQKYALSIDHIATSRDQISLILEQKQLKDWMINEIRHRIYEDLKLYENDKLNSISEPLMDRSIILAVGEGMKHKPGVMQRITGALAKEGINIESIDQGASEISVALGVKQEHSKQAVNAIHNEFFK